MRHLYNSPFLEKWEGQAPPLATCPGLGCHHQNSASIGPVWHQCSHLWDCHALEHPQTIKLGTALCGLLFPDFPAVSGGLRGTGSRAQCTLLDTLTADTGRFLRVRSTAVYVVWKPNKKLHLRCTQGPAPYPYGKVATQSSQYNSQR